MKDWVWNIFLMIAALSFIEIIMPEGGIQKYLKFIFSLMVLGVIVYPLGNATFNEINTSAPIFNEAEELSDAGESLLERITLVQTKQIEDVYREKVDALQEDEPTYQNEGISIPWTDIYSNDGEESN